MLSVVIPTTRDNYELEKSLKGYEVLIQREKGLVNARNVGWHKSKYDIVAFIDDDVILSPGWAIEIEKSFIDPNVGCVMGGVELVGKDNRDNTWTIPFMRTFFKRLGNIQACNMVFRKEALIKSGGFDPIYDSGVGEWSEPDLVYRVASLGYKVVHNEEAKLIHLPSKQGIYKTRSKYSYWRMRNFLTFRKRWLSWDFNLLLVVLVFNLYWVYKSIRTLDYHWLGGLRASLR